MNKSIIMGPQGCGKGTQAKRLTERFDIVHISVGDIFRWNVQSHTKLAAKIHRIVSSGQLVPDEIVEEIVSSRLNEHDWNYGFVLDGFPRNATQALFFLESYDVDAVIYIDVPEEVVTERIMARRICSECGLDYNLIHHRPETEGVCDVCGGTLVHRSDDNEASLAKRLDDFNKKTLPTLELFKQKELVITIDGTQDVDTIHEEIVTKLKLTKKP